MRTADLSLRLVFAPAADEHQVAGHLRDEHGQEYSFSSWLGLLSLLEGVRARVLPVRAGPVAAGERGR